MSDERPNPLTDVLKGLGLLLRAAKTTVERLPTKDLEEVVLTSAREVGRAIENVATTVEREVFGVVVTADEIVFGKTVPFGGRQRQAGRQERRKIE